MLPSNVLRIVCLLVFLDAVGYGVTIPLIPLLSPTSSGVELGVLFSFYPLATLLTIIPLGFACDRFGRKPIIVLGVICYSISSLTFAFADTYSTLLLSRGIQGLGGTALWVGGLSIVTDIMQRNEIGRATSYIMLSFGLGAIIGPGLGALGSIRTPFYIIFALGGMALILSIFLPRTMPKKPTAERYGSIISDRTILMLLFNILIVALILGAIEGHTPRYLYDVEFEKWMVGVFFVVMAIAYSSIQIPLGRVIDRIGERKIMMGGFASSIITMIVAPLGGIIWMLFAIIILSVTLTLVFTPSTSYLGKVAPPSQRGLSMGLWNGAWALGYVVGPVAGGAIVDSLTYPWMFLILMMCLLIAMLIFLKTPMRGGNNENTREPSTISLTENP
ncbi:MAG: MFS transporter [Methermicoccaceae archaeon]